MARAPSSVRVASRYALLAPVRSWRATWRVLERKMVATQERLRAIGDLEEDLLDEVGVLNSVRITRLADEISNLRLQFDASVAKVDAKEAGALPWLQQDLEAAIQAWDRKVSSLPDIEAAISGAGDLSDYYDSKDIAALREVPALIAGHRQLMQETLDRMVSQRATIFAPLPETMKPKATETMWHASVNARELVSSGFLREPPQDSLGLGGSQSDSGGNPSTSFTYELYLAKEIARSFKEISLIAKGSVTGPHILDWIRRLGKTKAEQVLDFARHNGVGRDEYKGRLQFEDGEWVATRVNRHRAGGLDRVPLSEVFTDKGKVINLYLSYIKHAPGRLDPFYVRGGMGLARQFAGVNPNNIGIVQATIDMSHPGLKRIPIEREYRVPVDAIMSVDKLIR